MMHKIFFIFLFSCFFSAASVSAHTLGVDKAELIELAEGQYELASFVPPKLAHLITTPNLPQHCDFVGNPGGEAGTYEVRFSFSCKGPLTAEHQLILPWNREGVMLTVNWKNQEPVTKFSEREGSAIIVELEEYLAGSGSIWKAAKRYTILGFDHILAGFDHLLFVFGLLIIVGGAWPLVKTITAFTLAHSITLGLATMGYVNVPSKPVEAVIALSIVFLAVEIVYASRGRHNLTYRIPWLVAFAFGLLHGLGFAGALSEIGLPPVEIPIALLFFNIGVELGQLVFVFGIVTVIFTLSKAGIKEYHWARLAPAYFIGTIACYWLFERMGSILLLI